MMINAVTPEPHKSKGLFIADRILEYLYQVHNSSKDYRYAQQIRAAFHNEYGRLEDNMLQQILERLLADGFISIADYDGHNLVHSKCEVSLTEQGKNIAMKHPYMGTVMQVNDINNILIALLVNGGHFYMHEVGDRQFEWLEMNNSHVSSTFYKIQQERQLAKYVELLNNDKLLQIKYGKKVALIQFLESGGIKEEIIEHRELPSTIIYNNHIHMENSTANSVAMQQHTTNSNQTVNIQPPSDESIKQFIAEVKASIESLRGQLADDNIETIKEEVVDAEKYIVKKPGIAKQLLKGIASILKPVPSQIITKVITNPKVIDQILENF